MYAFINRHNWSHSGKPSSTLDSMNKSC